MAFDPTPQQDSPQRSWRRGAVVGATVGISAASLSFAASSGLAAMMARYMVVPPKKRVNVSILGLETDPFSGLELVTIQATPDTRTSGTYAIRFDEGAGLVRVGYIVRQTTTTVTRVVEQVCGGELAAGKKGRWSGTVHTTPADAGLAYTDIELDTHVGPAPAWLIPADPHASSAAHSDTWVIMVHGRGAQRAECIRGAGVTHELGLTTLVVSYRNDREAPSSSDGRYGLGFTEWEDVERGIEYALAHGAQDIVLMGWSMGGAIVLRTAELTRYRHKIRAMVLTGPVVNWFEVMAFHSRAHWIPSGVGRLATGMISHRLGPRITGLAAPLDLHALDWVTRWEDITTPTLILHSSEDEVVPVQGSVRLAEKNTHVDFVGFNGARHTKEWNIDRERYERSIRDWLARVLERPATDAA